MSRIMWAYLFSLKKLKLVIDLLLCSETRALRRLQNAQIKNDELHFLAKLPKNDSRVPDDYPLNVNGFIRLCEPPFLVPADALWYLNRLLPLQADSLLRFADCSKPTSFPSPLPSTNQLRTSLLSWASIRRLCWGSLPLAPRLTEGTQSELHDSTIHVERMC